MAYIGDKKKRSNVKHTRLRGIAKKAFELATLCGGSVVLHYIDENGSTYMYADDEIYNRYEEDMMQKKNPTITFPAVHSLAKLDANGYINKSTHKQGKQWKVSVRTKEDQVTHAPAQIPQEPDVLVIEATPIDPTPTKNSPGDLNYLPLSRTPTATATTTATITCPTTVSIHPTATISRPTVSHPKETVSSPTAIRTQSPPQASPGATHIIEMPVHVAGQTIVSEIEVHHLPPSTSVKDMPIIAPVKSRRRIIPKGRLRESETLCASCDIIYSEEHDNENHPLGSWLGCETCETWVHRKCIQYSFNDLKTKRWFCDTCRTPKNKYM